MNHLTKTQIIQTLHEYSHFTDGWDGDYSIAPKSIDIHNAIQLLDLFPEVLGYPIPMLSNNGSVQFYWDNDIYYIDIVIEENNEFSLYAKNRPTLQEHFSDNIKIDNNVSTVMLKILARLNIHR